MLASLKSHWLSSVVGVIEASLVSFAATANLDQLTFGQALWAYGIALAMALKGFVTADAKAVAELAPAK